MSSLQTAGDTALDGAPTSVASAQRSLIGALVAAATFAVLAPTLRYGFVFDDEMLITGNVNLQWSHLGRLLSSPFWAVAEDGVPAVYNHLGHFYRPVVSFSYLLDKTIYSGGAWGFHLSNCLMQALAAWLTYRLLLRFFPAVWQAALLALAFGVHPSNTEVVAAIHGRTDLYATVFVLAALLLYQRRPAQLRAGLWLPAFALSVALALGSKEQSVLLLPAFAGLHALPEAKDWGLTWRGRWALWAAAAAVTIGFFALRALATRDIPPLHWSFTAETAGKSLAEVLELMGASLAPWFNYAHASQLRLEPLALELELAGCGLVLAFALRRRARLAASGALWFAACVLISYWGASAVYAGELDRLVKRYAFMGLPGLLCVVGCCLPLELNGRRLSATLAAGALVAGSFAVQTLMRNEMYRDSLALWQAMTREQPKHELAFYNLGRELMVRGDYKAAAEALAMGVQLNPIYMGGYQQINLTTALLELGDRAEAGRVVAQALRYFPDNATLLGLDEQLNTSARLGLDQLLQQAMAAQLAGQYEESLKVLTIVHAQRPNFGLSRFLAGYARQRLDQLDLAIGEYDLAARYSPGHPFTFVNLGYLFLQRGEPERARQSFEKAAALLPGDANVAWGLGESKRQLETAQAAQAQPAAAPAQPAAAPN